MNRHEFHKIFKTAGPVVLPVIHVQTREQTERNVLLALHERAPGVLLINHDFPYAQFLPIITHIRSKFPSLWLGVNFLGVTGEVAFPILAELLKQGVPVDAYWADDSCVDERVGITEQKASQEIQDVRQKSGWKGMYFGGTAFKKQRPVADESLEKAAKTAIQFMDVVTTSGIATGEAASTEKIKAMRKGCGECSLALASGVTPENAANYAEDVDCFIVATGISAPGDFYNFDPLRLHALMCVVQSASYSFKRATDEGWYINLVSPNTKGPSFAWLDPSSIYLNGQAFKELTEDLVRPFRSSEVDLVAGIDGMGFPLGAAIATKLGKAFIAIRKAGRLCVETDSQSYVDYSKREKSLEIRKNAFPPSTRVLAVDQWVETGATMRAALSLIERQQGIVAGVVAICIETHSPLATEIREKYKCSFAIPKKLQAKFDEHSYFG